MDKNAADTALSGVDAALAGIEIATSFLGSPIGPPAQPPNLDDPSCQAIVQQVETPDWVYDAAELRQEQLIEAGNEAAAIPEPEYADHAPPPDAGPAAMGGIF